MATGGLSFPKMGTDGTGHRLVQRLGHSMHPVYPALTPLKGAHPAGGQLAGEHSTRYLLEDGVCIKRLVAAQAFVPLAPSVAAAIKPVKPSQVSHYTMRRFPACLLRVRARRRGKASGRTGQHSCSRTEATAGPASLTSLMASQWRLREGLLFQVTYQSPIQHILVCKPCRCRHSADLLW